MGEPFLLDGLEFAVLTVKGQSFMLHQIRKMVGMAVCVVRGHAGVDVLDRAWREERVHLPRAPGLGLMLEEVHYENYNRRFGSDGMHESLDWSSVAESVEEFKMKSVFADIARTEKEERSMLEWLGVLPLHGFEGRHFEDEEEGQDRTPLKQALGQIGRAKREEKEEATVQEEDEVSK